MNSLFALLLFSNIYIHIRAEVQSDLVLKHLDQIESNQNCSRIPPLRLQNLSPSKQEAFYSCKENEIQKSYYWVKDNKNQLVIEPIKPFPKCCPLNHIYNTKTHSCIQNRTDGSFIKESFVKIGLPNCRIIGDYILESEDDFFMKNSIYLHNQRLGFLEENYCVDLNELGGFVVKGCEEDFEVCRRSRCIHKCCPDGQSFVGGANCRDTFTKGVLLNFSHSIDSPTEPFSTIHNYSCRIYKVNENRYSYNLNNEGVLRIYYNNTKAFKKFSVEEEEYCIDHFTTKKGESGYAIFFCFDQQDDNLKYSVSVWAKIASIAALLLTIIVYIILNIIKNVFGKVLINYSISSLIMFSLLTFIHFNTDTFSDKACVAVGYFTIYAAFCGFSWLNVICYDIWRCLGSTTTNIVATSGRERKRFLYYFCYGWGLPLALTLIILFFERIDILPYTIQPFVGKYKCFLENYVVRKHNYSSMLFKDFPILLMEAYNTFLFCKTIKYCLQVKSEIHKMNDTNQSVRDKKRKFAVENEKLGLILKLSIIMGISFLFEVVSSFYNFRNHEATRYIEIVWDTVNCLQGVFIFIAFLCKKKVYNDLVNKFKCGRIRKISLNSLSTTPATLSTKNGSATPILNRRNQDSSKFN